MSILLHRRQPAWQLTFGKWLNRNCLPGPVAQLAEQQTLNLRVVGSIPTRLTSLRSRLPSHA
jgi:hypothetical protein